MSYRDRTKIEEACYEIAPSFECIWPIRGMLYADVISRMSLSLAISARREVEGLRDNSSTPMDEARMRAVLSDHLAATAVKFKEFCNPATNPVISEYPQEDRDKVMAIFTPDLAESFQIYIVAATELVRNGVPLDQIAEQAKNISRDRIFDAAFTPPDPIADLSKRSAPQPLI